jgi:hypothetical protein
VIHSAPRPRSARTAAWGFALASLFASASAHAYRPFDGTDGDVAAPGEFELELGPAHLYREGSDTYLLAPTTVLNLGLVPRLELVGDFTNMVALGPTSVQRDRLVGTDIFLKYLLRRGTLQDESGLSIAAEGGPLLPEIGGSPHFGAQLRLIFSYGTNFGAVHFNEQVADTREHVLDLWSGVILEGPESLPVRPVSEFFVEHNRLDGTTMSALLGAIWKVSDSLALDGAVRVARIDTTPAEELRLGLTWTFPVWGRAKATTDARLAR